MNFKINHIKMICKKSKIKFLLENEEVSSIEYDCLQFNHKENLNKENFDVLYKVVEKEIKDICKGSIFRPILNMDVSYISKKIFSELHKQFFLEIGLSLPVRNFEFID